MMLLLSFQSRCKNIPIFETKSYQQILSTGVWLWCSSVSGVCFAWMALLIFRDIPYTRFSEGPMYLKLPFELQKSYSDSVQLIDGHPPDLCPSGFVGV